MAITNVKQLLVEAPKYLDFLESKLPAGIPQIADMLVSTAQGLPAIPDFPIALPDLPDVPALPAPPATNGTTTAAGVKAAPTGSGIKSFVYE